MSILAPFRSASLFPIRLACITSHSLQLYSIPAAQQCSNSLLPISCQTTQVRYRSNRSRRGLYDGKDIRTGNNVPFSLKKTKRKFLPNVFIKRVYSEVLGTMIPFHLTASALRSIDKAGGLDHYLLTSKHVTEGEGFKIKQKILRKMETCKKKGMEILGKVMLKSSSSEGGMSTAKNAL